MVYVVYDREATHLTTTSNHGARPIHTFALVWHWEVHVSGAPGGYPPYRGITHVPLFFFFFPSAEAQAT